METLATQPMIRLTVLLCIGLASACTGRTTNVDDPEPCSEPWNQLVEARLQTGDPEGHGPDVGSMEWRSVVEFKLGIRGDADVPSRESDEWCTFIDAMVGLHQL